MGDVFVVLKEERAKKGKYHIRKKDAIQKDKLMTKVRKRVWKKEKQA